VDHAARTLESFAGLDEMQSRSACSTRLLISPGYRWKHVDALLTNFHLPRSTLMAMVSAMLPGGAEELRSLYSQALSHGYRFYSFGDAMLVL
jgi:S-adenosylmethionine:tRNA ribosyltransferase-isomerase